MYNAQPLIDEITNTKGVLDSAKVYIESVPTAIQNAIDEVLANGLTAEQIAPVQQVADQMKASADAVVAAIAANPGKPSPPVRPS